MDSQLQQNSYGDTPTYYPRPGERDASGGSPPWSRRGRGRGGFRGARHGDSGLVCGVTLFSSTFVFHLADVLMRVGSLLVVSSCLIEYSGTSITDTIENQYFVPYSKVSPTQGLLVYFR